MSSNSNLVTVVASHTLHSLNLIPPPIFPSSTSITFGPFDACPPSTPTSVVFVYRQVKSKGPISIERLRKALGGLLDYYPHLTGRLLLNTDGIHDIVRLDAGAQLLIANCSRPLHLFSTTSGRILMPDLPGTGNALLVPFDTTDERVYNNPLSTLQHTRFACGGVDLGIRVAHMVCDALGLF